MTRDKMIVRFYELEDELNNVRIPKRDVPVHISEMMIERQRLAFAIARSMPRAPQTIAVVTPHPHGPNPARFSVG